LEDDSFRIYKNGLTAIEAIGLMQSALWDLELRTKLGFNTQYVEEMGNGNTSTSTETNNGPSNNT
jgi:hypothetical protein